MRYGVLGPLEVSRNGQAIDLGGYKQRALLAILLIDRNRVVSPERIIDRLWNGYPPGSAASTLQGYLSHLRGALQGPGETRTQRIATHTSGYVLHVEPGDVDADRFTELAKAGAAALAADDAYGACEVFDQALALWRGPALVDFETESFAAEGRVRLEELCEQVREDHVEARLALGWHARLLPELQNLVQRHPLRERLRGQLMLALYRSGRQVEALEVYRQGREELADQLGIDPGPALPRLEAAILRQEPSLDVGLAATTAAAPDARVDHPDADTPAATPAATPGATESNIAEPLSPIIGRDRELDEIAALLDRSRLVTLTGPGGTGKTRLATEVARRLRTPAVDGPWLIELAGLSDPGLVPNSVAQTLGLVVRPDGEVAAQVASVLQGRPAVLLLDNCEHLLGAVAALAQELLGRCAGLRILTTSREPLKVAGEDVFGVAPLPVADRTDEARLVDGDAMLLFEARAAAVLPGFAITAENRSVVRRICRELDGLPLAIELAAARLRLLSPEQLAEHLADRFALLAGGSRTAQPRQRALRTTVEWSFDLLDADEEELFTTLSVFRGGFGLDAVTGLWDGQHAAVLDLLDALVSKSLVTVDTTADPRRYGMLRTLQEYGWQRLSADDSDALRLRHAIWCAEKAADGEAGLRGADWIGWLRRLDAEHDNIRAAVSFALGTGRGDIAARITGSLGWYWFRRGYVDEARQWLERCNELRPDEPTEPWVYVLLSLASVRHMSGDVEEARRLGSLAMDAARACGTERPLAMAAVDCAYFESLADPDTATKHAEEGLRLARDLGLQWLEAGAVTALGNIARGRGDFDGAETLIVQGAQLAARAEYWWQAWMSRWLAAKVALSRGNPDVALEQLRGVVQDLARAGDWSGALVALHGLASAVAQTSSATQGAVLLGAVAAAAERLGFYPQLLDPAHAAQIDNHVRAGLSQDAFTAAYERGRALTRQELVALVDEVAAA